jgi:diketogulonate reductase-like aldo/keto reductase
VLSTGPLIQLVCLVRFVPLPKSNTPARIISNSELYDFKLELEDIEELDAMDLGKKGSFINPKYYPPNTP